MVEHLTVGPVVTATPPQKPRAVLVVEAVRRLGVVLIVLLSLVSAVISLRDRNDQAKRNGEQITDLQHQVMAAATKLEAARSADQQRIDCQALYDRVATAAYRGQQSLIGELVVDITKIPPGPAREAATKATIDLLDMQNGAYAVAAKAADTYPGTLPCPITPQPKG